MFDCGKRQFSEHPGRWAFGRCNLNTDDEPSGPTASNHRHPRTAIYRPQLSTLYIFELPIMPPVSGVPSTALGKVRYLSVVAPRHPQRDRAVLRSCVEGADSTAIHRHGIRVAAECNGLVDRRVTTRVDNSRVCRLGDIVSREKVAGIFRQRSLNRETGVIGAPGNADKNQRDDGDCS